MVAAIRKFFEGFGVEIAGIFLVIGVALIAALIFLVDVPINRALGFAIGTSPIWLPLVLFLIFFEKWRFFVTQQFGMDQGNVTLEILLPEEIFKSPLAMELVLNHLYQTASADNLVQTYWDGKHPPTYGLELVSEGGRIHFYINAPRKKFKNIIETQLYSQYPGIEIRELPIDYTAEVDNNLEEFEAFAIHFGLKKADPYPIKTYVEYGLDLNPKEEEKIDPITQVLEMLGSVGPHERIWIQILISAHREENFRTGSLFGTPDWKDAIKKEINSLMKRDDKGMGDPELEGMPRVTPGEQNVVRALERSLSKYPFNTAIRAVYAAKKGYYLPGERIGAIITSWFGYNDANLNSFGLKWRTDYNWNWWQDPTGKKRAAHKRREVAHYKSRVFDGQVQGDTKFIMTSEELATIFHLPGKVAVTPTLARIPSSRAEAPANLPVGTPE